MEKFVKNLKRGGLPTRCWLYMLILLLSFGLPESIFAQTDLVKVTGTVTDETNQPVPGVNVLLKGSSNIGTVTDIEGKYTLNIPKDATLIFKFVGYKTTEVAVNGKTTVNLSIQPDVKQLEDVVVIGYQAIKREKSTAAIASVAGEKIENIPVPSVEMALQGKVAGLNVLNITGEPGAKGIVTLRGNTSIASQDSRSTPLYVVDGIVMDEGDLGQIDLTGTNPIAGINPNDIESIDVLKDASASAIYGARAANGVIIIKTKTPKAGKPQVRLNGYYGVAMKPTMRSTLVGTAERHLKMDLIYQYLGKPGMENVNYWITDSLNPAFNNHTDWQSNVIQKARIQNYDVNVSAYGEKTSYRLSYNFYDEEGTVIGTGFTRNTASLYLNARPYSFLNLTGNIRFSEMSRKKTNGSINIFSTWSFPSSFFKLTDEDIENFKGNNLDELDKNLNRDLYANFQANIDFTPYLKWTTSYSFGYSTTRNDYFIPSYRNNGNAYATSSSGSVKRWEIENYIQYLRSFKETHNLSVLFGQGAEYSYIDNLWGEGNYIASNSIQTIQGVVSKNSNASSSIEERARLSWFARLSYDYKDKYLFSANWRMDGSSRFGDNNKWGYFPSAAFGWRINEEEFVKELDIFSNLKLRLSAGRSGNTAIPAFRTLSTLSTSFAPMSGDKPTYGVVLDRPENKDLKWETTAQYDVGLDMGFFDNRLTVTVDAYLKRTKDLLLERNAPYYSGYKKAWANIGNIQNKGLEVTIGGQIVNTRDFYFNADFNIAFNRSKVLSIPGGEMFFDPKVISGSGNVVVIREGQPLGQWYGYKVDGVYTSQAEIDALPDNYEALSIKKADLRPGDHRFIDVNNDGKITSDDKTIIGKGEPDFSGGFSLSAGYKGFSLSAIFQYSYGVDVFNANLATLDAGRENYNQTRHLLDSYTPTLYDLNGNLVYQGNPNGKYRLPGGVAENYCLSEFIEDGSFLRLSDITLAYDFNRKTLAKLHLGGLRLFLTGRNLFVWTKYYGFDPEVNTRQNGIGDIMPSLDYGSYPRARAFSFGVNVSF